MPPDSEVFELMNEIKNMDCQPAVFNVWLSVASYRLGFRASVDFRAPRGSSGPSSIDCHGDTPEEALTKLRDSLIASFGKCPVCGAYRNQGQP
jgi:hypothetical protein